LTTAAVLLAAAVLAAAGPSLSRTRAGITVRPARPRRRAGHDSDPLAVASSLDVLAVCLMAGMTVPAAAAATAPSAASSSAAGR